jgi:hypothetical protein
MLWLTPATKDPGDAQAALSRNPLVKPDCRPILRC